jgi:hypothetical protein
VPFEIGHGLVTINPIGGVPAYGRRPAKGSRRFGVCAYCKRSLAISVDHVIPRALFESALDSLIRVPSCDECQAAKAAGEERLRALVLFDVGATYRGNVHALAARIARAHLRNPGLSTQRLLDSKQVELTSAGGIYLGEAIQADWDYAAILRTMEFIVRGLWFHVDRNPLPRHADVGISFIPPLVRQQIASWLAPFSLSEFFSLGNGVAHIEFFRVVRKTRIDSFWVIVFNGGVLFLGGTGAYARPIRGLTNRREIEGYYDPRICRARRANTAASIASTARSCMSGTT